MRAGVFSRWQHILMSPLTTEARYQKSPCLAWVCLGVPQTNSHTVSDSQMKGFLVNISSINFIITRMHGCLWNDWISLALSGYVADGEHLYCYLLRVPLVINPCFHIVTLPFSWGQWQQHLDFNGNRICLASLTFNPSRGVHSWNYFLIRIIIWPSQLLQCPLPPPTQPPAPNSSSPGQFFGGEDSHLMKLWLKYL